MSEYKEKFFVIMPSGNNSEYKDGPEEADFIYQEIIYKSIVEIFGNDVYIEREVDSKQSGAIDKNIVKKIAESDYAIVDITGRNPNVFFELGLRYALRSKTTILIRQIQTPIPFDIGTYRCITYSPKYNGVKLACDDIKEALRVAKIGIESDSLVYNVYPNLAVTLNGENGDSSVRPYDMPWDYFWRRFSFYIDLLEKKLDEFMPDYIVGISNGGLFLSDTIYRLTYREHQVPLISFWANRNEKNYFQNPFCQTVLATAKAGFQEKNSKGRCKLLIFDDVVDSGKTIKEFKIFVNEGFPEADLFYIPLFSRNKKLDWIKKETIWDRPEFKKDLAEFDFAKYCYTDFNHLPYLKLINFKA